MEKQSQQLDQLAINVPARIEDIIIDDDLYRLQEMGIEAGEMIEISHFAPISKDPIALWVGGRLIALRRELAQKVRVMQCEHKDRYCRNTPLKNGTKSA